MFAVGNTLHGCSEEKPLASLALGPGIYFHLLDTVCFHVQLSLSTSNS